MRPEAYWFGEDQARYVVVTSNKDKLLQNAKEKNIPARVIAYAGGDGLVFPSGSVITIARLREANNGFFTALMKG